MQKAKVSNMRVYLTGNNLKYITKYRGLNPEQGGGDNGRYPMPSNFIVGANVNF